MDSTVCQLIPSNTENFVIFWGGDVVIYSKNKRILFAYYSKFWWTLRIVWFYSCRDCKTSQVSDRIWSTYLNIITLTIKRKWGFTLFSNWSITHEIKIACVSAIELKRCERNRYRWRLCWLICWWMPALRIYCWRALGAGPMRKKLLEVMLHIRFWLPSHPSFFTVLFGITTTYL